MQGHLQEPKLTMLLHRESHNLHGLQAAAASAWHKAGHMQPGHAVSLLTYCIFRAYQLMLCLSAVPQGCYAVQATLKPSDSSLGSCKEGSSSAPGRLTLPQPQSTPVYPHLPQSTDNILASHLINLSGQQHVSSSTHLIFGVFHPVTCRASEQWLGIGFSLISTSCVTVWL